MSQLDPAYRRIAVDYRKAARPLRRYLERAFGRFALPSHTTTGDTTYRAALVCDLMEPLRPFVDRAALEFVQSQTFQRADFTIRSDGACRLNPHMKKQVVGLLETRLAGPDVLRAFPC